MNKYEIIIDYIKSEISRKTIKPGEKLPSIRVICKKLNCSKVTAVKAYNLLEKDHIIYSVPKSGHYLIGKKLKSEEDVIDEKIDFSSSSPDSTILPYDDFQHCINEAMKSYKSSLFNNCDVHGLPSLIKTLHKQLQNYQVFTDTNNIFITSGSQQAISILTRMPFPSGRNNVLVEEPTYYGALNSLELNHTSAIGIRRTYEGIDFNEFENILKNGDIKFFYTIPRFHNPTGFSYSTKDKKTILRLCEKYNVYIVEDDYLADLEVNKKSDPLYAMDISSKVIYLKTFSKVLLPGLRISVDVIPNELSKTFSEFKKWNDLNTSVLSQGALEIYINSGMFNAHIRKLKKVYSSRMHYLNELIKKTDYKNIKWYVPGSGFFASFEISENINIKKLITRLNSKKILLSDNSKFYLGNTSDNKLIRLSISNVNTFQIKKGVSAISNEINLLAHTK